MGRPKGSKNKRVEVAQTFGTASTVTLDRPEFNQACDLILGVRHLGSESKFPGLWQLVRIEQDGTEKILIDASSKMSILNIARLEIGRCI